MNTLIISLKEYSIGLAIFLIPIISFMSQNNLRQLGTFDLYLILTSLIAILLVLLIFSTLLQYSIIKIFKTRPHSIFLLSCFGFLSFVSVYPYLRNSYNNNFSKRKRSIFYFIFSILNLVNYTNSSLTFSEIWSIISKKHVYFCVY